MTQILRIATRQSTLALWQANYVRDLLLESNSELQVEIIGFTTEGDRNQRSPLSQIGGKGLFVKELELALLNGSADIAVHSMKDVPSELPAGLEIAVICERADPRDALITRDGSTLKDFSSKASIGTSSLRRRLQLQQKLPHLDYLDLRGNVDTRIGKLDDGLYDGIILATAGLSRLGLADRISEIIPVNVCLPSAGQGAVGIECRSDDQLVKSVIAPLNHENTELCVTTERAVTAQLGANCTLPIAVYADLQGGQISLHSFVSDQSGKTILKRAAMGRRIDSLRIAEEVASGLMSEGAAALIADEGGQQ
jgi:hydroxymethylbilane synthase